MCAFPTLWSVFLTLCTGFKWLFADLFHSYLKRDIQFQTICLPLSKIFFYKRSLLFTFCYCFSSHQCIRSIYLSLTKHRRCTCTHYYVVDSPQGGQEEVLCADGRNGPSGEPTNPTTVNLPEEPGYPENPFFPGINTNFINNPWGSYYPGFWRNNNAFPWSFFPGRFRNNNSYYPSNRFGGFLPWYRK